MTHILNEKKSAQIRLKIAPIARATSRVGQIWSQIVFLIFWKIQYPDSGYFQLRFSSQNLDIWSKLWLSPYSTIAVRAVQQTFALGALLHWPR